MLIFIAGYGVKIEMRGANEANAPLATRWVWAGQATWQISVMGRANFDF